MTVAKFDTKGLIGKRTDRGYNATTATGRAIWPSDPRVEDICIEDIAWGLARICRFNGAIKPGLGTYSVAQHSVHVMDAVWGVHGSQYEGLLLAALLHDAPEYVLGDMTKPTKQLYPSRKGHEAKWARIIEEWAGLPAGALDDPRIKEQDYRAVLTEHRDLQVNTGEVDWGLEQAKAQPWPYRITPWTPQYAAERFISAFIGNQPRRQK